MARSDDYYQPKDDYPGDEPFEVSSYARESNRLMSPHLDAPVSARGPKDPFYVGGVTGLTYGGEEFGAEAAYRTMHRAKAASNGMYERVLEGRGLPPTISDRGEQFSRPFEPDGETDRRYDYR